MIMGIWEDSFKGVNGEFLYLFTKLLILRKQNYRSLVFSVPKTMAAH